MSERFESRRRFQLRLATLFWLTCSVACFFAGRNWEAISDSIRSTVTKNGTQIRLPTGKATLITSPSSIPRAMLTDPTVCRVIPISPTQIQVAALKKGATSLNVWDANGTMKTYDITVPK